MTIALMPFEREDVGPAEGVITLTLHQPDRPVVVLDHALLRAIDATLDEIESAYGGDLAGFVLASDSRVFVAGADLKEIMGLDDAALDAYLAFGQRVYGRIARLPCSTVAAINGAVLGGGLEIAMHCDRLIAARPVPREPGGEVRQYQVGLPEAGLSICPGWGGTNLLPARMEPGRAMALTATGRTLTVADAAEAGLIERLVEPEALLAEARTLAVEPKDAPRPEPIAITNAPLRAAASEALAAVRGDLPDTQAARAVVSCIEAGLTGGWEAALDAERCNLVRLRGTAEGKAAIERFFGKSGG